MIYECIFLMCHMTVDDVNVNVLDVILCCHKIYKKQNTAPTLKNMYMK